AAAIGLSNDFGILDDEDSRDLVKTCLKNAGAASSSARFPKPKVVQSVLSFSTNARESVEETVARHYPHLASFTREFEKIKISYEQKKRKTNNLDYDDL